MILNRFLLIISASLSSRFEVYIRGAIFFSLPSFTNVDMVRLISGLLEENIISCRCSGILLSINLQKSHVKKVYCQLSHKFFTSKIFVLKIFHVSQQNT